MAELTLEQTLDLGDYLAAFRRRRKMIASISSVVFLLGLITAFIWPPTYQSSATILIEEQEIPTELIQSTVTSYASQRIQVINQRVMSRTNLLEIIDKYKLYESERKRDTIEEVLAEMREDIGVDMITAEVMDPRTGRPGAATIAFTLAFESESPTQAQKVATELTTLYLNENLKSRTEKAAETYDFLTAESTRLSEEISRLETLMAEFKERNIKTLPELRDLNSQVLQRTEREISEVDTQIRTLEERKIYLQGQLGMLDPYSGGDVLSPDARLDALRTEYIRLASRYSPDHPDVTSIKREIKALEIETGRYTSADDLRAELNALREQLGVAQQSYTDEHPDVKSLKRQIATLVKDLQNPPPAPKQSTTPVNADNPAYVTMQSQLAAANTEI
ncbi:MAG TPA: Wzz/FepE/Etk N-terminal domain-containing protein, partial [Gammaproteobacteria bacterium]|nr:Wzz/FepE/Etk N-terminal domain-containing protein [Gammaproteobacteria bacterium]